jgi:hypothetical protein
MTAVGIVIMAGSISSVVGLTVFCLYRVLTLPPVEIEELNVAPLEIETPDIEDRAQPPVE